MENYHNLAAIQTLPVAGIYIHIPFCAQACHYCDFHFSTNQKLIDPICAAIVRELAFYAEEWQSEPITSLYFGGGTPSLIAASKIETIINEVRDGFPLTADAEITLEANPEDINSLQTLYDWQASGINRLSIGIQSFDGAVLKWMNRAHNEHQAKNALELCAKAGLNDLSLDLIFGIPSQDDEYWPQQLETAVGFAPDHLSVYGLTIEEQTVFGHRHKKGLLTEIPDDNAAQQMQLAMSFLAQNGYEQYEISNYARNGKYAKHNSSYWKEQKYLGIGPSAHSFNGTSRWHNIASNSKYIIQSNDKFIPTIEILSNTDQINDYILCSLRTKWGCDLSYIKEKWGVDLEKEKSKIIERFNTAGYWSSKNDAFILSQKGKLLCDSITAEMFF